MDKNNPESQTICNFGSPTIDLRTINTYIGIAGEAHGEIVDCEVRTVANEILATKGRPIFVMLSREGGSVLSAMLNIFAKER